ncbi:hypothetical protein [Streptomyces platensis]|uniref:hypothetical protein n=1 Tax=Streptomyces platensis TaxID=58346 RepID=UPI002E81984E|nr:hypothetical protein [Streptomyces platensis]WUB84549.1 hypothetical protein OG424_38470 [Streptomyces platensis]
MKKMTRAKAAMAAVAVLTLAMGMAGGTGGSATAAARVAAEPEKTCTSTDTFWMEGSPGKKANVSLCAQTDGTFMNVTGATDCFWMWGGGQYDQCRASGSWELRRDGKAVANGDIDNGGIGGSQQFYPGPGTYTLVADVSADGSQDGSSPGSWHEIHASGQMQRTITLSTPLAAGPRLQGAVSEGGYGPTALTVTNKGDGTAKAVSIQLRASGGGDTAKVTDDKRCKTDDRGDDLECTLGDLAAGASQTVSLKTDEASKLCDREYGGLYWSYKAENFPEWPEPGAKMGICPQY